MSGRSLRDEDAGDLVRGLQRVSATQGVADAFADGIHPFFSNRSVSSLIGVTPKKLNNHRIHAGLPKCRGSSEMNS